MSEGGSFCCVTLSWINFLIIEMLSHTPMFSGLASLSFFLSLFPFLSSFSNSFPTAYCCAPECLIKNQSSVCVCVHVLTQFAQCKGAGVGHLCSRMSKPELPLGSYTPVVQLPDGAPRKGRAPAGLSDKPLKTSELI
jgi:hypothetical protein